MTSPSREEALRLIRQCQTTTTVPEYKGGPAMLEENEAIALIHLARQSAPQGKPVIEAFSCRKEEKGKIACRVHCGDWEQCTCSSGLRARSDFLKSFARDVARYGTVLGNSPADFGARIGWDAASEWYRHAFASPPTKPAAVPAGWYDRVPKRCRYTLRISGVLTQDDDGPWVIRSEVDRALSAAPPPPKVEQTPPCIGNDPLCPCQDDLACHYLDAPDGTKAWPIPAKVEQPDTDVVRELLREAREWLAHAEDNCLNDNALWKPARFMERSYAALQSSQRKGRG